MPNQRLKSARVSVSTEPKEESVTKTNLRNLLSLITTKTKTSRLTRVTEPFSILGSRIYLEISQREILTEPIINSHKKKQDYRVLQRP